MLSPNGTCVTAIVKSSAGRSGRRRRQGRASGSGERRTVPAVASAVLMELRYCRRDLLTGLNCSIDRLLSGDRRRELLRAAVSDILELRNPDVLDARQAGPLRR